MDIGRGKGASKCSETGTEKSDGNGNSKHSLMHTELVGNQSYTHSSGTSTGTSDHSQEHIELGVASDPFYFNQDVFNGTESSKVVSAKQQRLSSSSSSSTSSTDDQFQANKKLSESRSGIAFTSSSKRDGEHHVSATATSTSRVPSFVHGPTVTISPPLQMMDQEGGYDPYRISSSVFKRRNSLTPADWSIASNESLFSIQVENNSFSREHFLYSKSGEFSKSDEELFALSPSTDKKSVEFEKSEGTLISDGGAKDKTDPSAEEPSEEKPTYPPRFWTSPTHSDVGTILKMAEMLFPWKKKGSNSNSNKDKDEKKNKSPCHLQHPRNYLAAETVVLVFLVVNGNGNAAHGIGTGVAPVTIVVKENDIEKYSQPALSLPKTKILWKIYGLYYRMFALI
ncbi:hornerin isoform X4 [Gossypium australe]|uniref:Hornerin isoform X4 n=1 Tax=Gossypium australe TaxID=47621 RepID=A0A5B6X1H1_9ROSI|nr:hornerin isoform X4 [Gossypium australe]